MKAAKLYGKEDLRVVDVPVPEITEDELLLRTKAATVCGTDLRMVSNGAAGADEDHPLTICHEFAGIIEKTGKNVVGYEAGQRVSIAPNFGCGICDLCVSGNSHHCKKLIAIGINLDGGFSEFVRIPAFAIAHGNVTPLADSVSFEAAAASEALACVVNAFERYKVNPGDVVLIIGAGAIGMMHAKLALMAGASYAILNDISEERLALCKTLDPGITVVTNNLAEEVNKYSGGKGADVVITACGVQSVQEDAFNYSALNGRVNFFGGLPSGRTANIDTNQIHYKQLDVSGTTRSSLDHYRKAIDFVAKGLIDLDVLVSDRYPIEDIHKAFENASAQRGMKHAVVFD